MSLTYLFPLECFIGLKSDYCHVIHFIFLHKASASSITIEFKFTQLTVKMLALDLAYVAFVSILTT